MAANTFVATVVGVDVDDGRRRRLRSHREQDLIPFDYVRLTARQNGVRLYDNSFMCFL